jgi:phosphoribosylformimino-5-aminoimidazole carboxamide ribotide isomerase
MAGFQLIPVIDLMGGIVVHARAGERARYEPLRSGLADGSEAIDIVRGVLGLHPFDTLYIADLDAIQRRGDHFPLIDRLRARFPDLRLWVDAGFDDLDAALRFLDADLGEMVLGSESQHDLGLLDALGNERRLVLSLDFKGEERLGPDALFERPDLWPERVIVMTLARVGGAAGPDLARLAMIREQAPARRLLAAGGVRGRDDLAALVHAGAAGVLLASALHDGRLTARDLADLHATGSGRWTSKTKAPPRDAGGTS